MELVITFMLTAVFTTGSCRLMADAMKIYNKIQALNNAQQVMDIVLDKVTGEIEGAQVNMRGKTDGDPDGATLTITKDGKKIRLYDRVSRDVIICQEDGEAVIHYKAIHGSDERERYRATDWKFDKSVYLGFKVADNGLKFSLAGEDYPPNVVKVELTLTAPGHGSFTNTRYVECYNFETAQDMQKIKTVEEITE